jgi:hypothetical protein
MDRYFLGDCRFIHSLGLLAAQLQILFIHRDTALWRAMRTFNLVVPGSFPFISCISLSDRSE